MRHVAARQPGCATPTRDMDDDVCDIRCRMVIRVDIDVEELRRSH
jgi:hypothetical protein